MGQLNFRLTQILTGHGVFAKYRKKIGKSKSAMCWFCAGEEDDPAHTLLRCSNWANDRQILFEKLELQGPTANSKIIF